MVARVIRLHRDEIAGQQRAVEIVKRGFVHKAGHIIAEPIIPSSRGRPEGRNLEIREGSMNLRCAKLAEVGLVADQYDKQHDTGKDAWLQTSQRKHEC